MNATIGGQALLPHATIFSGDSLQVNEGAAVVAVNQSSRMIFGRQTTASFLRDGNEITVLLSRGTLSLYHPQEGGALRVKVGDVTVAPAKGFKTLGEVAMVGGGVLITAKEGSLRVEGNGSALDVAKGKSITIPSKTTTARAPQGGGGQILGGSALEVAGLGASALAAVLAGIGISRANDAKSAANAATAAAATAGSKADAATAAATAAGATAAAEADLVGCAMNTFAVATGDVKASIFKPSSSGTPGPGC
jgi:hypothetical protein